MFNVCPGCGEYSVEKTVEPSGPLAICPVCGYRHPFRQLPLFVVTGASGSGKTTVALRLIEHLPECVVMESDILWRGEFNTPDDGYRTYRDLWLRMAKNIGQSGRPVVLCGSAIPDQFEGCPERRYFTDLHYLALTCDAETLTARLRNRPSWRQAGHDEFVERMVTFNRWLEEHASTTQPPMTLLHTSNLTLAETVEKIIAWVRDHLSPGTVSTPSGGQP